MIRRQSEKERTAAGKLFILQFPALKLHREPLHDWLLPGPPVEAGFVQQVKWLK